MGLERRALDRRAWHEAIVIDAASGVRPLPATPGREVLGADRTWHVDPVSGSDANDGLSAGAAFQTAAGRH